MWVHAVDTLWRAVRRPGPWLVLLLGVGAGWLGLELAVLALGDRQAQATEVASTTGVAFGALLALWVLASTFEENRRAPGWRDMILVTRPGRAGRLLGQWAGATLLGALGGAAVSLGLGISATGSPGSLLLYITIIVQVLHVGAWGLVLGTTWAGGAVVVGGLGLWVLGHLPWGTAGLLPGGPGRALAAVLPGGALETIAPSALAAGLLACGGLLALALGTTSRAESGS